MTDLTKLTLEELERLKENLEHHIEDMHHTWHEIVPQWRRDLIQVEQELTRR